MIVPLDSADLNRFGDAPCGSRTDALGYELPAQFRIVALLEEILRLRRAGWNCRAVLMGQGPMENEDNGAVASIFKQPRRPSPLR